MLRSVLLFSTLFFPFHAFTQVTFAQVGIPPSQRGQSQQRDNPRPNTPQFPNPFSEDVLDLLFSEDLYDNDDGFDEFMEDDQRSTGQSPVVHVLSTQDVAKLNTHQQRSLLRKAVQTLDEDFDRIKTGSSWKKHLRIEHLGRLLWCGNSISPDADARDMLKTISTQFDTVFRNPKYEAIATLWGFQTIRNALPEYSMSPIEISRRDTNHATVNFLRSLDQVTHAASWKKFLHTDELKKLVQSDQELTLDDAERIQTISGQFKKVEDNPKYSAIAELNGFASTNQNVAKLAKEIVQLKSSPLSNDVPPALANVTFNAKIVRETLDQYQDAHRAWEQTADNSEDAENARKVLMAIKEKHERANQNSNEQMKKLQGLIAQSIKKHQANDRNARGTVKLLDLNDDSDTGNQILSQLVISMRDMNTLRRQQQEAEKQWKKARNQSAEADKANKALMVITRNHEAAKQKSNEQMKMLKLLLNETTSSEDRYSADNAHKTVMLLDDRQQDEDQIVTLLQFSEKSDSQPAEVMLMQFEETPENEPAEVIVMQFQEDENGSGDVVLMQFEEVNGEPQEVVLMQFEDVIEQSNCEDHTTEADKSSSEKDSK